MRATVARPTAATSRTSSAAMTHVGWRLAQRRAGEDREARAARARRTRGARHRCRPMCDSRPDSSATWTSPGSAGVAVDPHAGLLRGRAQLPDEVLPLAHAQVVQELGAAQPAELAARQLALALAQVAPQVQVGEEVGVLVGEAGVRLGRPAPAARPGARAGPGSTAPATMTITSSRARRARSASSTMRPRRGSTGSSREPAAERRQPRPVAASSAPSSLQQVDAVAHLAAVGRVEEREVLDRAEPERGHLQDHRRRGWCAGSRDR